MNQNDKSQSGSAVPSSNLLAESPWFPLPKEKMDELQKRIMSDDPKTEAEWWAKREIADLLDCIHQLAFSDTFAMEHAKRIGERYSANDQALPRLDSAGGAQQQESNEQRH